MLKRKRYKQYLYDEACQVPVRTRCRRKAMEAPNNAISTATTLSDTESCSSCSSVSDDESTPTSPTYLRSDEETAPAAPTGGVSSVDYNSRHCANGDRCDSYSEDSSSSDDDDCSPEPEESSEEATEMVSVA